jgi:hypothetical protein
MKRSTMAFGMVVLAVSMMAVSPATAQTQKADRQRTVWYLTTFADVLQRTSMSLENAQSLDQFARIHRAAAQRMRAIPWQGVDSEAVNLVWKTANLSEKVANLADRIQTACLLGAAGGGLVGSVIRNGVENEDAGAVVVGILAGIVGVAIATDADRQIEAQALELEREGERLAQQWENYLQRL